MSATMKVECEVSHNHGPYERLLQVERGRAATSGTGSGPVSERERRADPRESGSKAGSAGPPGREPQRTTDAPGQAAGLLCADSRSGRCVGRTCQGVLQPGFRTGCGATLTP